MARMNREEFEALLSRNGLTWDHRELCVRDREGVAVLRTKNIGWLETWTRIAAELTRLGYIAGDEHLITSSIAAERERNGTGHEPGKER